MSETFQNMIESDIVVFGAGPAGIAAAVAAAREGHRVHLVEIQNEIGGVMSSCPGMMLGGGYPCKQSIGGFFEEFVSRMENHQPPVAERRSCGLENFGDEVVYYPEYALSILYFMLEEAGVELLLNHTAVDVILQENSIVGVEAACSKGLVLIKAQTYIDCTGTGDIAFKAGVPCQLGNQEGKMMGVSLTFFMENVDWQTVFANSEDPYFTKYARQGIAEKKIHESLQQIYFLKGFREGTVLFNTVTITGVDGTDSVSVARGTAIARKRALELAKFCQGAIPGFENSYLTHIGRTVGIRETRKFEGVYKLTYDDVYLATKFEDGIVACDNPLDEVPRDDSVKHYSHESALTKGEYYTIPLRSLIPEKIRNLLFAGKIMSVDDKAFASVRGMPQCMAMGQAAAIGASYCIKSSSAVQDISHSYVVEKLVANRVRGIGGHPLVNT